MKLIESTRDFFRNVKFFLKNVWVFRKTLSRHRPWDYSGILLSMHDALDDMIDYGMPHVVNRNKHVKDMIVARELCKRIVDGTELKFNYDIEFDKPDDNGFRKSYISVTPKYDFPKSPNHTYSQRIENQDMEMLTKLLNRKLRSWWD